MPDCGICEAEGRGKVTVSERPKKSGGTYKANDDGSPHFLFQGIGDDGKNKFMHVRNRAEFDEAKNNPSNVSTSPTYKKPIEASVVAAPDSPTLTPGHQTPEHAAILAEVNTYILNVRKTAWDLAKDMNPKADNHSTKITACGFIHDFIELRAASLQASATLQLRDTLIQQGLTLSEMLKSLRELAECKTKKMKSN